MIISSLIIVRKINISDNICIETQATHFVFKNFFSGNRAVVRSCGKIWHRQTDIQATNDCSTTHWALLLDD